jgi:hypothetical protein
MNTYEIKRALRQFTGTEFYHKHLFPGKSPILLTDGCDFIRTHCNAREDSNLKPLISQVIEFSDFPLDYIKLYVIQGIALLPSEN